MIWYAANTVLLVIAGFFLGRIVESNRAKTMFKKIMGKYTDTMVESIIELLQNDKTESQVKSFLEDLKFRMMLKTLERKITK